MSIAEYETFNNDEPDEEVDEQLSDIWLSTDPVRDYMRQIGRTPLLKADEEVEIARAIEVGVFAQEKLDNDESISDEDRIDLEYLSRAGNRSTEHLINANLRLVVSIAKRYQGRGIDFLELIQEGNVGLNRAVQKFDYEKGFKFSTYATWWITQAIQRSIADHSRLIRLPVYADEALKKIQRFQRVFLSDVEREPTIREIAQGLEVDEQTVERYLEIHRREKSIVSLNLPIGDESDTELGDILRDNSRPGVVEEVESTILEQQRIDLLNELLDGISPREAEILRLRHGLGRSGKPMSSKELGEMYDLTPQRVTQIAKTAMTRIRRLKIAQDPQRNQDLLSD